MSNNFGRKMKRYQEGLKVNTQNPLLAAVQQVGKPSVNPLQQMIDPKQLEFQKAYHEIISQNQGKIQEINAGISQEQLKNLQERIVINYIADRNGCGYFRCIWPMELLSTYRNLMTLNSFIYHTDPSTLTKTHTLRFQRQATDPQVEAWNRYIQIRQQYGFHYKMQYEIDDALTLIEKSNVIAYNFFDDKKKQNHLYMLRTADSITFSTEALKEIYVTNYGIDASKIKVVKNHLPQFLYSLPLRNTVKEFSNERKMRVMWSGSASHCGPGGDLEFLEPMIRKSVDDFTFVFQGVFPQSLTDLVKEGKIEFIPWVPVYALANTQFYRARPDVCLAPLTPSVFNSVKSDLKLLESSALGAPCICTSFLNNSLKSPYDVANADICIEPNADSFRAVLDHLKNNPDYYMEIVKNQYKFLNGRWMENNLDQWIQSLL